MRNSKEAKRRLYNWKMRHYLHPESRMGHKPRKLKWNERRCIEKSGHIRIYKIKQKKRGSGRRGKSFDLLVASAMAGKRRIEKLREIEVERIKREVLDG